MIPVSGQAKGFRFHHYLSFAPFQSIISLRAPTPLVTIVPPVVIGIVAAILLAYRRKDNVDNRSLRAVTLALLIFPVVHLGILSLRSDWPLWLWYLYPFALLVFAGSVTLIMCARDRNKPLPKLAINLITICFIAFVSLYTALFIFVRKPNTLYLLSMDLAQFAANHPGVYAMGDRSGTPGFLIPSPVIQLEGLVMDKHFLSYIRSESDLTKVFQDYGVKYYIATDPALENGCYVVTEPARGGSDVPKMHGTICKKPVAHFSRSNGRGSGEEYIFDVH